MSLDLEVDDLRINAPSGRQVLHVPALRLAAGESLGIRGPSGAGKSTLLFALAGLLAPASGSVRWGTQKISGLSNRHATRFRRKHVGMIFQDFLLFEELSAFENATLSAAFSTRSEQKAREARGRDLLARLKVDHGQRSVESFSGGERQRVAIARALTADPDVILADEPTASLERGTADAVVDDLVALARTSSKTLVVVSHDAHVHERMDRVIDIFDGQLQGQW